MIYTGKKIPVLTWSHGGHNSARKRRNSVPVDGQVFPEELSSVYVSVSFVSRDQMATDHMNCKPPIQVINVIEDKKSFITFCEQAIVQERNVR